MLCAEEGGDRCLKGWGLTGSYWVGGAVLGSVFCFLELKIASVCDAVFREQLTSGCSFLLSYASSSSSSSSSSSLFYFVLFSQYVF